jgi:hypothetical protein
MIWIEIGGITCVGFSPIGSKLGWADASAIVALVWAFWCREKRPDFILIECVPELDIEPIIEVLNDMYSFMDCIICPTQLNNPARRGRFYGCFAKRSKFAFVPIAEYHMATAFGLVFDRPLTRTGGAYLLAPEAARIDHLKRLAAARGLVLFESDFRTLPAHVFLDVSSGRRLKRFMEAVEQREQAWGCPRPAHLFVNVRQNVEHAGISGRSFFNGSVWPTLLTASVLVDIGSSAMPGGRLVHPLEHFAAMGFKVSVTESGQLVPEHWAADFTDVEARRLTGNGMHLAAVGSWLLFVLACSQRV